ncbi:MAG TPA: hypothetical protein VN611_15230 [Patescibacteria group bacterium]|nr:hypothetical protein [Patescibacteria group bacterium]
MEWSESGEAEKSGSCINIEKRYLSAQDKQRYFEVSLTQPGGKRFVLACDVN